MIQMFDWYIEKIDSSSYLARGYVSGHPKLSDGTHIHTSHIVQAEESGRQAVMLVTHSGNQYRLAGEDICCEKAEMTEENLKVFGVRDFCKNAVPLSARKKKKKCRELGECLSGRELYLELLGENCMGAYFKDGSGGIQELRVMVHMGMFQDSILCLKEGVTDFRYFPKGFASPEIETYHVSSNIERIHIYNRGKEKILFNRKIVCEAQGVTVVEKQDFGGEGLFSPDAYDGECLLSGSILGK